MKPTRQPNQKSESDRIAEKRWEDEGGAPPDRPVSTESDLSAAAQESEEREPRRPKGKGRRE